MCPQQSTHRWPVDRRKVAGQNSDACHRRREPQRVSDRRRRTSARMKVRYHAHVSAGAERCGPPYHCDIEHPSIEQSLDRPVDQPRATEPDQRLVSPEPTGLPACQNDADDVWS